MPARIQGNNLLIEAVEACLVLLDELRFELRVAVTWHLNAHLPALALDGLRRAAVTRVAGVVARRSVLLVAKVVRQFTGERAFDQRFSELLEQALLAEQIVRLLVIFQ
jgi:hypothetical protein